MQILILEYITGGGLLTDPLTPHPAGSFLAEGMAMRNAIAEDFSQCRDEHDQPFVVDVNPNPDICYDGGFAGACAAAGYSYPQAISNIISMAVTRRNRRNALFNTLRKLQTKDAPKPARDSSRRRVGLSVAA